MKVDIYCILWLLVLWQHIFHFAQPLLCNCKVPQLCLIFFLPILTILCWVDIVQRWRLVTTGLADEQEFPVSLVRVGCLFALLDRRSATCIECMFWQFNYFFKYTSVTYIVCFSGDFKMSKKCCVHSCYYLL